MKKSGKSKPPVNYVPPEPWVRDVRDAIIFLRWALRETLDHKRLERIGLAKDYLMDATTKLEARIAGQERKE
jgi:hypothetical protein